MPGVEGFGFWTLRGLPEILLLRLTWRQLGLHDKPLILLNIDGFWDPLCDLLQHVVDSGFAGDNILQFVTVAEDVPALETMLQGAL